MKDRKADEGAIRRAFSDGNVMSGLIRARPMQGLKSARARMRERGR